MESVHETGLPYTDNIQLTQCGFIVEELKYDKRLQKLSSEHPLVLAQDEKAKDLGNGP